MMVKNNNFIKQIYKTCLRRLQKISIIHNLGLKSVFLYDKQSDYLRNKLNSLQNQIQLSTETFLKEYFIKKKNIFFRLKKQIMTELKQQVQEEYLQQMEQNNNEDLDVKNRFMKNKQNEEDEILIEALKAENTIQEFKQPKKSKLKLQNPNYRQNNNLIRSYQYYYKQNHQIQEINYDIETQVKQFIVIIESIGTYFKYYNPFNLKSIKQILSYLTPIIKYFICLPKILENLLMIKFKNPNKQFKIFNVKLDKIVNDAQKEFNNVYANLELISQKQHNFDKSYEKFRIEQLYPQNFKRSPFLYYNKSSKQSQNPQFKIKNFFTERYTLSQQNIINNLYTDILINLYCESSQTKTTVQNLLNKKLVNHQIQKFTKNYLDYPHFADFLVQVKQNQFDAIYILDYSKLYIGSPTMVHQKIKLSQEYFKYLGYNIILININDDQIMRKLKCGYIKG